MRMFITFLRKQFEIKSFTITFAEIIGLWTSLEIYCINSAIHFICLLFHVTLFLGIGDSFLFYHYSLNFLEKTKIFFMKIQDSHLFEWNLINVDMVREMNCRLFSERIENCRTLILIIWWHAQENLSVPNAFAKGLVLQFCYFIPLKPNYFLLENLN